MVKKRVIILVDFIIIVAIVVGFTYIGHTFGRMLGNAEGYNECHSQVVYPSRSELLKLEALIEEVSR
jgi:hypothetical protein